MGIFVRACNGFYARILRVYMGDIVRRAGKRGFAAEYGGRRLWGYQINVLWMLKRRGASARQLVAMIGIKDSMDLWIYIGPSIKLGLAQRRWCRGIPLYSLTAAGKEWLKTLNPPKWFIEWEESKRRPDSTENIGL